MQLQMIPFISHGSGLDLKHSPRQQTRRFSLYNYSKVKYSVPAVNSNPPAAPVRGPTPCSLGPIVMFVAGDMQKHHTETSV